MRKIILSLSTALLASTPVWAINCQVETDCTTLGYTETKDEGGCLKCPFGNKWACSTSGGVSKDCVVGAILNSDMSCSADVVSGKTPIGVVFDADRKLAIGTEVTKGYWSNGGDVPDLTNYASISEALGDWDGKKNTRVIVKLYQNGLKYAPAFEYVNRYTKIGAPAGNWYLPSAGELNAIFENKDILNETLEKIGGMKLDNSDYWSSTESTLTRAWSQNFRNGAIYTSGKLYTTARDNEYCIRPVINFSSISDPIPETIPDTGPCLVGSFLYADKTCSTEVIDNKPMIGLVYDPDKRLAIAFESTNLRWSEEYFDVPELTNYTEKEKALTDVNGKENTKIVSDYCKLNGKSCPAFEYANEYKTAGTKAGDWYIPSIGELSTFCQNETKLNTALDKINKSNFLNLYKSSTEYSEGGVWTVNLNDCSIAGSGGSKIYNSSVLFTKY